MVCAFTMNGSQICSSFMSASSPLLPSIPQVQASPAVSAALCLARTAVSSLIGLPPQFSMSVRGITSSAAATLRNGNCWMPSIVFDFAIRA